MKRWIQFGLFFILLLAAEPNQIWAEELANKDVLETEKAVNQALDADLSLQAAKLNLEASQKDLEGARRILNLNGNYSVQKVNENDWGTTSKSLTISSGGYLDPGNINPKWLITYTPDFIDSGQHYDYSCNLTLYPFNMAYERNIKVRESNYIRQSLNYQNTLVRLIAQVRNTYAEAVQKRELSKLAAEDLVLWRDQLIKTNALYNAGKIPRLDLMDAQQKVKAAESASQSADLNHQAGLLKLGTLLGKEDLNGVELKSESLTWAATDQIDLQATVEQSIQKGLDIKAAMLDVQIAGIQLQMDSFYLLKNINIGVGQNQPTDKSANTIYSIGFSGQFDDTYFRDRETSKKRYESAKLNSEVTIRNKRNAISDGYRSWRILELSLAPMQETLNIAKERLRITNLKYENGLASGSEVNLASIGLSDAEQDYWNTWLSVQQAREAFFEAVGGNPVFKPATGK